MEQHKMKQMFEKIWISYFVYPKIDVSAKAYAFSIIVNI